MDPFETAYYSPFMRNEDVYWHWNEERRRQLSQNTGTPVSGTTGGGSTAPGPGTGSGSSSDGTPSATIPVQQSGSGSTGRMVPGPVNDPGSYGSGRFGYPTPNDFGAITGGWAFEYPVPLFLGTIARLGGNPSLNSVWASYLTQRMAQGMPTAYLAVSGGNKDSYLFPDFVARAIREAVTPLSQFNPVTSVLFSAQEAADILRNLATGNYSALPGGLGELLAGEQDPERVTEMLTGLLNFMGLTGIPMNIVRAAIDDLDNFKSLYYTYVLSYSDPTGTAVSPTGILDFLRQSGWFNKWFGWLL